VEEKTFMVIYVLYWEHPRSLSFENKVTNQHPCETTHHESMRIPLSLKEEEKLKGGKKTTVSTVSSLGVESFSFLFEAGSPAEGGLEKELKQINVEKQAFERMNRLGLLEKYEGKYVAILGEKIVDVDEDKRKLAKRVYGKYGYRPIYIEKVGEKKPVRLPAPRRA